MISSSSCLDHLYIHLASSVVLRKQLKQKEQATKMKERKMKKII